MVRERSSSRAEDLQKKLAEQLSDKTRLSPEEIEEGVEKLIQRSRESLGGTELKPPYRRPVWYHRFFDLIQHKTISKFSFEFLKLNITQVKSETYKLQNGLRFLHLIDAKGNATPELEKLRVTGEAFQKNFAELIQKAYSDLFDTILVENVPPESVINFMITRYGYSQPLAEEATALFVYFCQEASIQVSQELASFRPKTERGGKKAKTKKIAKREKAEESEYDESFATLRYDEFSFAVKKDLAAIEFARNQVNALLDYLKNKLQKDERV